MGDQPVRSVGRGAGESAGEERAERAAEEPARGGCDELRGFRRERGDEELASEVPQVRVR